MSGPVVFYFPSFPGMPGQTPFFFSLADRFFRDIQQDLVMVHANDRYPMLLADKKKLADSWVLFSDRHLEGRYLRQEDDLAAQVTRLLNDDRRSIFISVPLNYDPPSDWRSCPRSSVFLLEVSPLIEAVLQCRQRLGQLLALGVERERIWPILTNEGLSGGLPKNVIEDHVGELKHSLACQLELQVLSENNGALIQNLEPRSTLSRGIKNLSEKMLGFFTRPQGIGTQAPMVIHNDQQIVDLVVSRLWLRVQNTESMELLSSEWLMKQMDQELEALLVERETVDPLEWQALRVRIKDRVLGLGPLEKFLGDPAINEVMVNGETIYVEREGVLEKTTERFSSEKQLRVVIDRMMSRSGRRVDFSSPMSDVRLLDGSRVNIILPPLSLAGPVVTIRRFRPCLRSVDDLLSMGSLSSESLEYLKKAVEERKNILIAGNTGSGKTTLLNIISGFISPQERIITLEDIAELVLKQEHVVRLETRSRNTEGAGEITMSQLLVNALRMRPDRIIIGECRGPEAVPMLQAMNTGHDGSMTTIHANSAFDAIGRLEAMVSLAVSNWPSVFIREQIAAGIDLVVYLKRHGALRKLMEIAHLRFHEGEIQLEPVFKAETL